MESTFKGSLIMRGSKFFINNSKLVEFMGGHYDDIKVKYIKGLKLF